MLIIHVTADLTDKVAKESKDSTASDHPIHDEDHSEATSGGKAKASDHQSKVRFYHASSPPPVYAGAYPAKDKPAPKNSKI
jgi:hypothetical protein